MAAILSRYRGWLGALILAAVSAALGFALGSRQFGAAMTDYRALQREHRELQRTFAARQQERVNLETADRINRASLERLRGLVSDLETRLARRKEELSLYRNLEADSETAAGLNLERFQLRTTSAPGGFDYRFLVRRKAALGEAIEASVKLKIEGVIHGIPYALAFEEADPSLRGEARDIRFKYFRVVEGSLTLPPFFEPVRVVIALSEAGEARPPVVRAFPWEPEAKW